MKQYGLWVSVLIISCTCMSIAETPMKKAFSEGIKASIKVIEYEKAQALEPIPKGYCGAVTGKNATLNIWEEVKLESLALFLNLKPSLFEAKIDETHSKKVLCLVISDDKDESLAKLKEVEKLYPKLNEYITKVEILPTEQMHRIIPGVGEYFEDNSAEVKALKAQIKPDDIYEKPLKGQIVLLEKKNNVVFDNNNTKVIKSKIVDVLFIEHTVYGRNM